MDVTPDNRKSNLGMGYPASVIKGTKNAKEIVTCARRIRERSSEVPDLMVMGDPLSSIIAFKSDTLNIQAVADIMLSEFGWSLNNLQQPAAFHICVTNANCRKADDFIRDLKTAVSKVKEMKDLSNCDAVAIYGLAEALPDRTYMKFVGEAYLDCLFMACKAELDEFH